MKNIVYAYYVAVALAVPAFLLFFAEPQTRPTAAECGVAEISPDMSTRDREVCRQLRQHRHRM
jgi:hypothetical protein